MNEVAVGLADAIAALRTELTTAMVAGQVEDVRFRLGPVELEFELTVERDVDAKGGVKFWVVSVEGKGRMAHEARHRIKLLLEPTYDDRGLVISSEQEHRPK